MYNHAQKTLITTIYRNMKFAVVLTSINNLIQPCQQRTSISNIKNRIIWKRSDHRNDDIRPSKQLGVLSSDLNTIF